MFPISASRATFSGFSAFDRLELPSTNYTLSILIFVALIILNLNVARLKHWRLSASSGTILGATLPVLVLVLAPSKPFKVFLGAASQILLALCISCGRVGDVLSLTSVRLLAL